MTRPRTLDPTTGAPERGLWLAVISLALSDLKAGKESAGMWFFSSLHKEDFESVCQMAGVELWRVQDIAEPFLGRLT